MNEFEERLNECLEALYAGRRSIDECLRRYPQHAADLQPHLLAALRVMHAYRTSPRPEFQRAARERFLVASGEKLREAFDEEPSPSFFAAARVRFLMTAHRMRRAREAKPAPARPFFGLPVRALATAGVTLTMFLSFSTYTVASASSALPGDWRYPIKRQTERVRLALAFGDEAERGVQLDLAAERIKEIEKLASRGKIIGPGVLEDLAKQTKPLVQDVDSDWGEEDIEELQAVTQRQKQVLEQVAPQVKPEAQDELVQASAVSREGLTRATQVLVLNSPPRVTTPSVPLKETPSTEPTDAAPPTETPVPGGTPPQAETPTPVPTQPPNDVIVVQPDEGQTALGISWVRVTIGRFSALVPSEGDGWSIFGVSQNDELSSAPPLLQLKNLDSTSLITINPRNGNMYWYVLREGRFDETQMRLKTVDEILVVDRDVLRAAYGAQAELPLFVLDSINFAPEPTPTPEPTEVAPPGATPTL